MKNITSKFIISLVVGGLVAFSGCGEKKSSIQKYANEGISREGWLDILVL